MLSKLRAFCLATAIGCAVSASSASAQMVEAKNPASLVEALTAAGYPAELKEDGSGDPLIVSSVDKRRMGIVFYGCKNNANCIYVSFYFGMVFEPGDKMPSAEEVAAWNKRGQFGRLFVDDDGSSIVLRHEVNLDKGGMNPALFVDTFEWFSAAITTVAMTVK